MSDWSFVTRVLEKDQKHRYPCFPLPRLQAFVYSTWSKPPKRVDVLSYYVYKLHIELILAVVKGTWQYRKPQKSSIDYPLTKDDLSPKDQHAYWSKTIHDLEDRLKTIRDHKLIIDWDVALSRPPHSDELQKDARRENLTELEHIDDELGVMSVTFMSQLKMIAGKFRDDIRPQMDHAYRRLMFMIEQTSTIQKRINTLSTQTFIDNYATQLKELDALQKELRVLELGDDKHQQSLLALMHSMENNADEKTIDEQLGKILLGKKHELYAPLNMLKRHYSNKSIVWDTMKSWRDKQLLPHAKKQHLSNRIREKQESQSELHRKAEFYGETRKEYEAQYHKIHDQWQAWFEETVDLLHTSQEELQRSYELLSPDFLIEDKLWRDDLKEAWIMYTNSLDKTERKEVNDQYDFLKQQALRPPLKHHMKQWHQYFKTSKGRVWELMETIEPARNSLLFWFYLLKMEFVMMLWI